MCVGISIEKRYQKLSDVRLFDKGKNFAKFVPEMTEKYIRKQKEWNEMCKYVSTDL